MNTEPAQAQKPDHDHDTPDGEGPCLHCLLTVAFEKWIEAQPEGKVDPAEAGYCIGQFFAETLNDVIDNGTHEHVHGFIDNFHSAQVETARLGKEEDAKAQVSAEPIVQPNPNTKH